MILRLLLILVAVLFVMGTAATVYLTLDDERGGLRGFVSQWDAPVNGDSSPRAFEIREGQSAVEIGRALEQQGLIRSALVFRLIVQSRNAEAKLGRGTYVLGSSMTTGQIVDALLAGPATRGRVFTIPEGWRAIQVGDHLERLGYVKATDFLEVVAKPERVAPFNHLIGDVPSLEGYLFPETYEIDSDAKSEAIVQRMVREFDRRMKGELRAKAQALELTLHQAVTLASIIEREAVVPEERRRISGVFHNRLRAGMPLQADATVQYALDSRDLQAAASFDFWKRDLTSEDLAISSPFNTYLVKELPPGPICSPGLASLEAAVTPEATDFYYFVAKGGGSHVFARTLAEHNRNVREAGKPIQPTPSP